MRRISEKICVISLFQMAEIVRDANFTIEQYVLRNIYGLVAALKVQVQQFSKGNCS